GARGFSIGLAAGASSRSGNSVAVSIGGGGGGGNHGANASVDSTGSIVTRGDRSRGIAAQSIGGGGGSGGLSGVVSGAVASQAARGAAVSVGGFGAGGGDAGEAHLRNRGDIVTAGGESGGLLAQSIGGGGGAAPWPSRARAAAERGDPRSPGRRRPARPRWSRPCRSPASARRGAPPISSASLPGALPCPAATGRAASPRSRSAAAAVRAA